MRSSVAGDPLRSSTEHGVLTLTLNRPDRRSAIDAELRAADDAVATEDHREGLAAARERREPTFKGT
jgi:enoyl-CoA hydratase/carnithine racemase